MKLTKQQAQAYKIIRKIIASCHKYPEFKKELVANPIPTIEKITGKPSNIPEGIRVRVEDQSDTSIIYFNIPPKPKPFQN